MALGGYRRAIPQMTRDRFRAAPLFRLDDPPFVRTDPTNLGRFNHDGTIGLRRRQGAYEVSYDGPGFFGRVGVGRHLNDREVWAFAQGNAWTARYLAAICSRVDDAIQRR